MRKQDLKDPNVALVGNQESFEAALKIALRN